MIRGNTFVISGVHTASRRDIKRLIESHGGIVKGAVSVHTDYLVAGEKSGSKLVKAVALGIEVIDEATLKRMSSPYSKLLQGTVKAANDRSRLECALREVFSAFAVPSTQQDKVIADVRAANFESLKKLIRG